MGKAWQPPKTNREFRFWITAHAVERFRERVEEELRARTDRDLAMLLDERIYVAMAAKHVTVVIDSEHADVDTTVAAIEGRTGAKHFVVMRPYRPSGHPPLRIVGAASGMGLAAITVVTEEMAAASYASGRWYVPHRPFASKLALVKPATPTAPPTAPERAEASFAEPLRAEPAPPTPVATESPRRSRGTATAPIDVRIEFAEQVLRERPYISLSGRDSLCEMIKARFGVTMGDELMRRLRDKVRAEVGAAPAPAPAIVTAPPTEPPPAIAPPPPPPVQRPDLGLAAQLAAALDAERMARARATSAERELAAAREILTGASSQVELLLAQVAEARS